VFVVEWYDSAASIVKTFNLTYYAKDSTIEMVFSFLPSMTLRINDHSSSDANTQIFN